MRRYFIFDPYEHHNIVSSFQISKKQRNRSLKTANHRKWRTLLRDSRHLSDVSPANVSRFGIFTHAGSSPTPQPLTTTRYTVLHLRVYMRVIEPSKPTEHDFKKLISALLYSIYRQTPFWQQLPSGNFVKICVCTSCKRRGTGAVCHAKENVSLFPIYSLALVQQVLQTAVRSCGMDFFNLHPS